MESTFAELVVRQPLGALEVSVHEAFKEASIAQLDTFLDVHGHREVEPVLYMKKHGLVVVFDDDGVSPM